MRTYTKEQITNIAINFLFDLEENCSFFSHMWDCSSKEDRDAMIASVEDSIIRRLKVDIDD